MRLPSADKCRVVEHLLCQLLSVLSPTFFLTLEIRSPCARRKTVRRPQMEFTKYTRQLFVRTVHRLVTLFALNHEGLGVLDLGRVGEAGVSGWQQTVQHYFHVLFRPFGFEVLAKVLRQFTRWRIIYINGSTPVISQEIDCSNHITTCYQLLNRAMYVNKTK